MLDNFEHVIEAARAVAELLSGAPGCGVIVTSRERLGVAAEQEYPVASLSPDAAVELFTARARQVEPGYEPGAEIDAICERLDRLPLALELAATRVKLLSGQQLLTRLEQRLPLPGWRAPRPPQAPQHDAGDDRVELRPAHPARAAAVHSAGGVRRQLRARGSRTDLRRRSRRHAVSDRQEPRAPRRQRPGLSHTTREYVLEHFDSSVERDEIRARHARWYFALGVADGDGPRQGIDDLIRLRQDAANVGLALAWAVDHDIAVALPLADAVFTPWLGAGRIRELERWYERALADPTALSPGDRAKALAGLGSALVFLERLEQARPALHRGAHALPGRRR